MAKLAEAEVARVLADREAPARIEADLACVESKEARLVDLLAEGDLAADAVEAKLGARGPASTLNWPVSSWHGLHCHEGNSSYDPRSDLRSHEHRQGGAAMKRDLNLYREILVKLETGPPLADGGWPRLDLPDRTEAEISYHAGLMHREGLIDALDVTNASTPAGQFDWKATGLTPQGHAFLEKIRDEKVWKAVLAKVGGASATIALSIIEEHAREYVKKRGAL